MKSKNLRENLHKLENFIEGEIERKETERGLGGWGLGRVAAGLITGL